MQSFKKIHKKYYSMYIHAGMIRISSSVQEVLYSQDNTTPKLNGIHNEMNVLSSLCGVCDDGVGVGVGEG